MLSPEQLAPIAGQAQAASQSLQAFLATTQDGTGHPLSDEQWFDFIDRLDGLRQAMTAAGCLEPGRLLTFPLAEKMTYAALRTLADDVRACSLDAALAGRPPVDVEAFAGRLASVANTLQDATEQRPKTPTRPSKKSKSTQTTDELTKVERALVLLTRNHNQSLRAVAKQVNCDPSLLSRDQRIQRMVEANLGRPPKGSKSRDGTIEATDDET